MKVFCKFLSKNCKLQRVDLHFLTQVSNCQVFWHFAMSTDNSTIIDHTVFNYQTYITIIEACKLQKHFKKSFFLNQKANIYRGRINHKCMYKATQMNESYKN